MAQVRLIRFTEDCKNTKRNFYTSKRLFKVCPNIENKPRLFADKKAFRDVKRRAERAFINKTERNMLNLSKNSPKKVLEKCQQF